MQAVIQKSRNTQNIERSKTSLDSLKSNSANLESWNDVGSISKNKKQKELTLDDLFKDYTGNTVVKEYDWGCTSGKEVW